MVLYETQKIKFTYDDKNNVLYQQWVGFMQFDEYKTAFDELLNIVKKHRVYYIISDTRQQAVVGMEASQYAASTIASMVKTGLLKLAIIQPTSVIAKLSITGIKNETQKLMPNEVGVKYFASEDDAKVWIFV